MSRLSRTALIPWCGRAEIRETLHHNAPILEAMACVPIVVNCGGDSHDLEHILRGSGLREVTQIDVPAPRFNKSLALNIGIDAAPPGIVLVLDADVLLTAGVADLLPDGARGDRFVTFNGVVARPAPPPPPYVGPTSFLQTLINESLTTFVWADGTTTTVLRGSTDRASGRRLGPGLLLSLIHISEPTRPY